MKNARTKEKSRINARMGNKGAAQKIGLSPGSLVHIGKVKTDKVRLTLFVYSNSYLKETEVSDLGLLHELLAGEGIKWLKIVGLHDAQLIGKVGNLLGLHPLVMEDILNTNQRPKVDQHEEYLFFTLKTLALSAGNDILSDQISFVLKKNLLISFHESELSVFQPIYERMKIEGGRIRNHGADYLFYALTDIVVDNYYGVLEGIGDQIDDMDDKILDNPQQQVLNEVQNHRKMLLFIKKTVSPLRDAIGVMLRAENELIDIRQLQYFRDVNDHVLHIAETIETYRDLNAGLKEMYLSALSNRMNQVMKTLTVIATIFIPLTFIVGVYGMNFSFMPELNWKYGYFAIWGLMLLIALWMLYRFRKAGWF